MAVHNPTDPKNWQGVPLEYSNHAIQQAEVRGVPVLRYLPIDRVRLVDCAVEDFGVRSVTFKVVEPHGGGFFIALTAAGRVITTWRKCDPERQDHWNAKKKMLTGRTPHQGRKHARPRMETASD